MKKYIACLLALCMIALCGCGAKQPAETSAPDITAAAPETAAPATQASSQAAEATEAPTEAPTEPPVYRNPLNGQIVDEPMTNRVFAVTVSNIREAMPHKGVAEADVIFEMFVNNSIIRCLALFSDISSVASVGSVRSTRPIFSDIATRYDLVFTHCNGSPEALKYEKDAGVDIIDIRDVSSVNAYWDNTRLSDKEHNLFAKGEGLWKTAEDKGMRMTQDPGKSYGFHFVDDGTPADGEDATTIDLRFIYEVLTTKDTTMLYDAELGKYTFNQYGKLMQDGDTKEVEAFENVIILLGEDHIDGGVYHYFDFASGGEGYFACGGKIIPITWSNASDSSPLTYKTLDGEDLQIGVGSTYIALMPIGSKVEYK